MTLPNDRSRFAARAVRAAALVVAAACTVAALGCASAPRREEVCLGEKYVDVRNDTGEPVDVYMVSGGISRLVTTVGSGRSELPVPSGSDAGAYYRGRRARDGRWLNTGHRSGDPTSRLTIQVQCDTPRP